MVIAIQIWNSLVTILDGTPLLVRLSLLPLAASVSTGGALINVPLSIGKDVVAAGPCILHAGSAAGSSGSCAAVVELTAGSCVVATHGSVANVSDVSIPEIAGYDATAIAVDICPVVIYIDISIAVEIIAIESCCAVVIPYIGRAIDAGSPPAAIAPAAPVGSVPASDRDTEVEPT